MRACVLEKDRKTDECASVSVCAWTDLFGNSVVLSCYIKGV